jgi:hypothetical protein
MSTDRDHLNVTAHLRSAAEHLAEAFDAATDADTYDAPAVAPGAAADLGAAIELLREAQARLRAALEAQQSARR